jgi:hypothetical protein
LLKFGEQLLPQFCNLHFRFFWVGLSDQFWLLLLGALALVGYWFSTRIILSVKVKEHFRVFGSKCYIKREDGIMRKFDSCMDKGVLVGYSSTMKAYKCYNLRLKKVVENINVTIDETGRQELKEEENESMEQLYEEEEDDEKEVEGEDEEDLT